jgi:hypothetical protein
MAAASRGDSGPGQAVTAPGLAVQRHPAPGCGWLVVHAASRMPFGFAVRLKRHAETAAAETAGTLKASPQWRAAAQVSGRWGELARQCCAGGEHYSPLTYAAGGRCSGPGGGARRS